MSKTDKEAYVSFNTARLLKEKGFDWKVPTYYCDDSNYTEHSIIEYRVENYNAHKSHISAPTQAMAMRWLRETCDVMIIPNRDKIVDVAPNPYYDYFCIITHNGNEYWVSSLDLPEGQHYTEYEDVVEAALQYCLKNIIK